jgi:hypothetical protein
MTAEQSISGLEGELSLRREFKASGNEVLACSFFEKMTALEDIFGSHWMLWIAHPVVLHFAQTISADRTGAEILSPIFAWWRGALNQCVERLIQRVLREIRPIEIKHFLHLAQNDLT